MEVQTELIAASRLAQWRAGWPRLRDRLKRTAKGLLPFLAGIAAAFVGMLLYAAIYPAPTPLTLKDVNTAVQQAMASATPRPAYASQVYQIIQPSLVVIEARSAEAGEEEGGALGSGVLISDQGDILTALHIVKDASEIQLIFADGSQSRGQIVSTQPENDIAVLQPEQLPALLIPAVLGNPRAMRVGDEAFAVGNPFGLYASLSAGVISGFERSFQAEGSDQLIEGLIQIDSAVNPGNSGGPLLNRQGQVIGIVVGILNPTQEKVFIGIGFAVPISIAGGAAGVPQY